MGGIDALVFTAGVGEHASRSPSKPSVTASIAWVLELDPRRKRQLSYRCRRGHAQLARPNLSSSPTREDVTMLREVLEVLGDGVCEAAKSFVRQDIHQLNGRIHPSR